MLFCSQWLAPLLQTCQCWNGSSWIRARWTCFGRSQGFVDHSCSSSCQCTWRVRRWTVKPCLSCNHHTRKGLLRLSRWTSFGRFQSSSNSTLWLERTLQHPCSLSNQVHLENRCGFFAFVFWWKENHCRSRPKWNGWRRGSHKTCPGSSAFPSHTQWRQRQR